MSSSSFISIAKITKTRGVRGEVSAIVLTDFPDRFQDVDKVRLSSPDNESWETLERFRFHKDRVLLKFAGRDSIEEVADFAGCEVQVPESDRVSLPEDTFFDDQLEECRVVEEGKTLGKVDRVFRGGGESVNLVVTLEDTREIMIPFVGEFIERVDIGRREILVTLPDGLLDTASRR